MTLYGKIIEACNKPEGLSLYDICTALGKKQTTMSTMLCDMVKRGRLYRTGALKFMRYFGTEADAIAYAPIGHAAYVAMKEAARVKDQQRRNAKRRKHPLGSRPVKVAKEKVQAPPKVPKPKPVKLVTPKSIVFRSVVGKLADNPKANIVWPETVQIQRIPTPPPRFEFKPEPGWKGQITSDWMDRRLSGVSA